MLNYWALFNVEKMKHINEDAVLVINCQQYWFNISPTSLTRNT